MFHVSSLMYNVSSFTLQRYNIFRALPNFDPRFGAILTSKCSNSAELMQAVFFEPLNPSCPTLEILFVANVGLAGV
jgi:hypothetical protein